MKGQYHVVVDRRTWEDLMAKKAHLENVYKKKVSWARMLSMPVEKGLYEMVSIEDLNGGEWAIQIFRPRRRHGGDIEQGMGRKG